MPKNLTDLMSNSDGQEELRRLAVEEPEELERLFRAEIDALIQRAPEKNKAILKALQVDIDLIRYDILAPLDRCVAIMHLIAQNSQQTKTQCHKIDHILETGEKVDDDDSLDIDFNN